MKKLSLLIPVMLFLASCMKDNSFPRIENITKGSKWTLKIGSSPEEVYGQLQLLGKEKNFNRVAIIYRKSYSTPEEIKKSISFYDAITLQSSSAVIERTVIKFVQDSVSSIEMGGGMLEPVSAWPQELPGKEAIQINDQVNEVYQKLLRFFQLPTYNHYRIILPDKPLDRPYDPDMTNYKEWYFVFSRNISNLKTGNNAVRLYFKNNELVKIANEYNEYEIVY